MPDTRETTESRVKWQEARKAQGAKSVELLIPMPPPSERKRQLYPSLVMQLDVEKLKQGRVHGDVELCEIRTREQGVRLVRESMPKIVI